MRIKSKILYAAVVVSALMVSCTKGELAETQIPEGAEGQPIKFNFFVEEGDNLIPYQDYWNATNPQLPGPLTRAADNDLSIGFKLYGWYNSIDAPDGISSMTCSEDAPADKRFFDGITVNRDGTYSGEKRFWVADGTTRHSFAAISGKSTRGSYLYKGFTKAAFVPVADHYVDSDPKYQTDLLVAYGPINIISNSTAPTVNITFKHALSKILFKLIVKGGVTLHNCSMGITYAESAVRENVAYYYTGKYFTSWSGSLSGTYTIGSNLIIPASANSEETAVELGNMKMHSGLNLPDGWLTVTIKYAKTLGGALEAPLKTKLPARILQQGVQYTYYLLVNEFTDNLSVTGVTLEPWTTELRMADPL